MSMTNLNPKGDALLVLSILVQNCPEDQFTKPTVLGIVQKVGQEPNPQNILKGADYVAYMQAKEKSRVVHGPATTDRQPGGV